jgi:signal peptidase I
MPLKRFFKKSLSYIIIFILLFLLIKIYLIGSFEVSSRSMNPALFPGDFILVNKLCPGPRIQLHPYSSLNRRIKFINIKNNDVLVFNLLSHCEGIPCIDTKAFYVKRCVGLPGDTIEYRTTNNVKYMYLPKEGEKITLDLNNYFDYSKIIEFETGRKLRILENNFYLGTERVSSHTFKYGYYYVLGDNLIKSHDSRDFGPIPECVIIGKVSIILISRDSLNKFRFNRFMKSAI